MIMIGGRPPLTASELEAPDTHLARADAELDMRQGIG